MYDPGALSHGGGGGDGPRSNIELMDEFVFSCLLRVYMNMDFLVGKINQFHDNQTVSPEGRINSENGSRPGPNTFISV